MKTVLQEVKPIVEKMFTHLHAHPEISWKEIETTSYLRQLIGNEGYEATTFGKNEPELALDWRLKIRTIFQRLFREGYALVSVNRTTLGIHYYQVVKRNTISLNTNERGEIE